MIKLVYPIFFICILFASFEAYSQVSEFNSQELSEKEGIPVIIKHLPDWKNKQKEAVFITDSEKLRETLGERPVFKYIEFIGGAEAAAAAYPEGKLLIVEFTSPQVSSETDAAIKQYFQENQEIPYKRIGNYNVFVFDSTDDTASMALINQVKYQKVIRWLGPDPDADRRAERKFIKTTANLFISTVIVIVSGFGVAVLIGIIVGFIFFNIRKKSRAQMSTYSDGGGLTRLNLDALTPPDVSDTNLLDK